MNLNPSVNSLPYEVWSEIFSYLDRRDLFQCLMVSKCLFNRSAPHLWRSLRKSPENINRNQNKLVQGFKSTTNVLVSSHISRSYHEYVQHIDLGSCVVTVHVFQTTLLPFFQQAFAKCHNLRRIAFPYIDTSQVKSQMPVERLGDRIARLMKLVVNLPRLTFMSIRCVNPSTLCEVLSEDEIRHAWGRIKTVQLHQVYMGLNISAALKEILNMCSNIRELTIAFPSGFGRKRIAFRSSEWDNIIECKYPLKVKLDDISSFKVRRTISRILTTPPSNVTALSLTLNSSIMKALPFILSSLPCLCDLRMSGYYVRDLNLLYWHLPKLKRLWCGLTILDDDAFCQMLQLQGRNLEYIYIQGRSAVKLDLSHFLPKLKELATTSSAFEGRLEEFVSMLQSSSVRIVDIDFIPIQYIVYAISSILNIPQMIFRAVTSNHSLSKCYATPDEECLALEDSLKKALALRPNRLPRYVLRYNSLQNPNYFELSKSYPLLKKYVHFIDENDRDSWLD
ncbi:hypothetical protein BKA69DRAFT_1124365 [Paraphysoderma sedebokerense]|nr:hypothetical protein BKA69DRAFT_1124365 [Paraphysoderma sedebokerense]